MPMQARTLRRRQLCIAAWAVAAALLCASPGRGAAPAAGATQQKHPDVVSVAVRASGVERFDFDVTVSSPYDTPQRYADALRVSAKDGAVLGERRLLHDHADEQPFTRDLHGVRVPRGVRVVVVQARDSQFGYGGKTVEVALPGRD